MPSLLSKFKFGFGDVASDISEFVLWIMVKLCSGIIIVSSNSNVLSLGSYLKIKLYFLEIISMASEMVKLSPSYISFISCNKNLMKSSSF